jgi:hypothetical protein
MLRLMMRAAVVASREATTTERFGRVLANAMARRTAVSGVMSTFTSPETPRSPNRARAPLDSQMMLLVTRAPGSTDLKG